jgi:Zn-dependent protease with chaperone function
MKYNGTGMHPSLGERQRASGTLNLDQSGVHFESEKGSVSLPLQGLVFQEGQSGIRLFYFSHPQYPGWNVYTSDKSVLKDPLFLTSQDLQQQLKSVHSGALRNRGFIALVLFLVLLFFYSLYLAKTPLTNSIVDAVPAEWETELGDFVFKQYKVQHSFLSSEKADEYLQELTAPLESAIVDKRYPFQFHIAIDTMVNAFALPGGHVVINSGLISAARTPEEVAGVLAHEISHVQKRHSIKQMVSSLGVFAVVQLFFGDVSGILGVLLENSSFLMSRKFSREHEFEADDNAFLILERANINPEGLISFFEILQERYEKQSDEEKEAIDEYLADGMQLLSTHPETRERIAVLRNKLEKSSAKGENYFSFPFEFDSFQSLVRNLTSGMEETKHED